MGTARAGRCRTRLRGGMQMVDVRDVADVHAALMTPGRGARRYVCGGILVAFDDMITALERVRTAASGGSR